MFEIQKISNVSPIDFKAIATTKDVRFNARFLVIGKNWIRWTKIKDACGRVKSSVGLAYERSLT